MAAKICKQSSAWVSQIAKTQRIRSVVDTCSICASLIRPQLIAICIKRRLSTIEYRVSTIEYRVSVFASGESTVGLQLRELAKIMTNSHTRSSRLLEPVFSSALRAPDIVSTVLQRPRLLLSLHNSTHGRQKATNCTLQV